MTDTPPADASRAATGVVLTTVLIDLIGFGIVLPLLPSYALRMQVSEAEIGFLVASFSLMQFLLAPWWGSLSDRVGRRPVLLAGLAGSAVSYLLFALAQDFWLLLLSRLVAGGMGATVNVAQAYLADVTPPERRSRAMGLVGAAFGVGFVIGPAIGGLSSRLGDMAPGLVASALTGANFLVAFIRLPETRHHVHRSDDTVSLHWRILIPPFSTFWLATVAYTVMYVVFPLQAERVLEYRRNQVAYLFVVLGVVTASVQGGLVGRLAQRWGEGSLMVAGCTLMATGLGTMPLAFEPSMPAGARLPVLLGSMLLLATGAGLVTPSATGYVSRVTPSRGQGAALGRLMSTGAIARIVGPIMAGVITEQVSARAAFLVAAGAAAAAGIASAAVGRARRLIPG